MSEKKTQHGFMLTDNDYRRLKLLAKGEGRTMSGQIVFMVDQRLKEIRRERAAEAAIIAELNKDTAVEHAKLAKQIAEGERETRKK
jgi:hypothetical protein